MNLSLSVSIVINNYNYGRFLRRAIDSALAQTYPETEVIVVDDGSTDSSRAIIAAYGSRVIPVLQENGGQAAALNAGFARSRGTLVLFLDADDMLFPQIVEQVAVVFRANPQAVRVQFRLAVTDAAGAPTGEMKPPQQAPIPSGNLREPVLRYGDDLSWLPTSGNAFTAQVLRQIFPIPVSPYRICADYYLSNLTPLFGCVMALDVTGGYYRIHAANHHQTSQFNLEQLRQNIVRTKQTHVYLQETAQRLGLASVAGVRVAAYSVTYPANRLVSLRLDPARHPLPDDTRLGLARRGMWAALRRPHLSLALRIMYLAWFCLQAAAPGASAVRLLAELLFYPGWTGRRFRQRLANLPAFRSVSMHKSRTGK